MNHSHRQSFALPRWSTHRFIVGVVANLFALSAVAVQFIPLGPGHVAWDVSGDGKTVVGDTSSSGFRWTIASGFELLPDLRTANGVSFDGSVIAGTIPKVGIT